MYKILLLSHGRFCEGALDTLKIFLPDTDFVTAIPFYTQGVNGDELLEDYIASIAADDVVLVFTDLLTGSVNQKVMQGLGQLPNVLVVTGFNLPALFEAATLDEDSATPEQLRALLPGWREGLMYMADYQPETFADDE